MSQTVTTLYRAEWNRGWPESTALSARYNLHWSVIPLDSDKRPVKTGGSYDDGNPKRLKWKHLQTRLTTEQEVRKWQKQYNPPAWAVITGIHSKVIVLDWDGETGNATMKRLGIDPHVRTGSGGHHSYFKHPGWPVATLNNKSSKDKPWAQAYPGLDIRADGGYAAFCGSNESGKYEWLREPVPDDLSILPEDLRRCLGLLESPGQTADKAPAAARPRVVSSDNLSDILLDRALSQAGQDGRDNAAFWLACQLRDNQVLGAESIMRAYARRVPPTNVKGQIEAFTEADALAKLASADTRPARAAWEAKTAEYRPSRHAMGNGSNGNGTGGPADTDEIEPEFVLDCLGKNEYGDGLLFARRFRGQAVYDHTEKIWYLWDVHHWTPDDTGYIKTLVSGMLANLYIDTMKPLNEQMSKLNGLPASEDAQETSKRQEQIAHLKKAISSLYARAVDLRSLARCKNVLAYASSEQGMGVTAERWDCNKWLLPMKNGVIDLHTGECHPGRPEDYLRSFAPTEWAGLDTPAPTFEKTLADAFEDRSEEERHATLGYLQRLFGYGITGLTVEQLLAVLYGDEGRNGKDTIQHAISYALGPLSGAISKDVFLDAGAQRAAGAATPHLCDLQGKRLAWASEPEKGARFNLSQVKELSGSGKIPVRPLYAKNFYEIEPTHLLILLTNHKPHADANESAFWDRLRLIIFNMRFVDTPKAGTNERKKDIMLWERLEQEASGIVAWLVRGCLEWQRQGLNTPQCIIDAGLAYRKEEDTIGQFIEECCYTKNPQEQGRAKQIYDAYKKWCDEGNLKALNGTNFGKALGKRFLKKSDMHGNYYQGVRLLATPDTPAQNALPMDSSMDSLQKPSIASEAASEADVSLSDTGNYGGYGGCLQQTGNYSIGNTVNEGLSTKTIHTIHNDPSETSVNQLVEPVQGTMDSSNKLSINTFDYPFDAIQLAGPKPLTHCRVCQRDYYLPRLKGEQWVWACGYCHPEVAQSQGREYVPTLDRGK